MTRYDLLALLSLSAVIGCASAIGNSPSPSPVSDASSEGIGTPVIGSEGTSRIWNVTPTEESQAYRSIVKTTIEERNTQERRKGGITTITDYLLKLSRSSKNVEISGSVSGFQVNTDQTSQLPSPPSFTLPLVFVGNITDHNIVLRSVGATQSNYSAPCSDSTQTILSTINRDLIVVPREMFTNQSWQDSTSNTICSGSLPLVVSMIRTYRITGETILDGITMLRLERTEKLLASGQGSQGQHQISLHGTGLGKAEVFIDRASGLLLSLTAVNQMELAIKSSGRIQNFTQTSQETVVQKTPR